MMIKKKAFLDSNVTIQEERRMRRSTRHCIVSGNISQVLIDSHFNKERQPILTIRTEEKFVHYKMTKAC